MATTTARSAEFLRGNLDMLILRALVGAARHPKDVARELGDVLESVVDVRPGSIQSRLRRLERSGLVASSWGRTVVNRGARFYRLTPAGWSELERMAVEWNRYVALVSGLMLTS
jgi:PadR family transcriptional regulator